MATTKNKIIGNVIDKIKSLFRRNQISQDLLQNKQSGNKPKSSGGLRLMTEDEMRKSGAGPGYRS